MKKNIEKISQHPAVADHGIQCVRHGSRNCKRASRRGCGGADGNA